MPPKTAANHRSWWTAVILGGPGWVVFGALKQATGLFITVWLLAKLDPAATATATEPVQQFLGVYEEMMPIWLSLVCPPLLAVATRGKYYLRRTDDGIDLPVFDADGNSSDAKLMCHGSGLEFERPDMMLSAEPGPHGKKQSTSSLALATDKTGRYVLPAQTSWSGLCTVCGGAVL